MADPADRIDRLLCSVTDGLAAQNKARRSHLDARIGELDRRVEGVCEQVARMAAAMAGRLEVEAKVRGVTCVNTYECKCVCVSVCAHMRCGGYPRPVLRIPVAMTPVCLCLRVGLLVRKPLPLKHEH